MKKLTIAALVITPFFVMGCSESEPDTVIVKESPPPEESPDFELNLKNDDGSISIKDKD